MSKEMRKKAEEYDPFGEKGFIDPVTFVWAHLQGFMPAADAIRQFVLWQVVCHDRRSKKYFESVKSIAETFAVKYDVAWEALATASSPVFLEGKPGERRREWKLRKTPPGTKRKVRKHGIIKRGEIKVHAPSNNELGAEFAPNSGINGIANAMAPKTAIIADEETTNPNNDNHFEDGIGALKAPNSGQSDSANTPNLGSAKEPNLGSGKTPNQSGSNSAEPPNPYREGTITEESRGKHPPHTHPSVLQVQEGNPDGNGTATSLDSLNDMSDTSSTLPETPTPPVAPPPPSPGGTPDGTAGGRWLFAEFRRLCHEVFPNAKLYPANEKDCDTINLLASKRRLPAEEWTALIGKWLAGLDAPGKKDLVPRRFAYWMDDGNDGNAPGPRPHVAAPATLRDAPQTDSIGECMTMLFSGVPRADGIWRACKCCGAVLTARWLSRPRPADGQRQLQLADALSEVRDCLVSHMSSRIGIGDARDIMAVTARWEKAAPPGMAMSGWREALDGIIAKVGLFEAFPSRDHDAESMGIFVRNLAAQGEAQREMR